MGGYFGGKATWLDTSTGCKAPVLVLPFGIGAAFRMTVGGSSSS